MTSTKPRVLIIDDDDIMLDLLEALLSGKGFDCHKAINFEDGLGAIKLNNFKYVFADIFMPGMGGIEGVRQIKRLDPFIPVMAVSGGYSEMSAEKAIEAAQMIGADCGLEKPFTEERFDQAFEALKAATIC